MCFLLELEGEGILNWETEMGSESEGGEAQGIELAADREKKACQARRDVLLTKGLVLLEVPPAILMAPVASTAGSR